MMPNLCHREAELFKQAKIFGRPLQTPGLDQPLTSWHKVALESSVITQCFPEIQCRCSKSLL